MSDNMIAWDLDADGILTLTMDDPDQGANTMNAKFQADLGTTVDRVVAEKDSITGVILTSVRSCFACRIISCAAAKQMKAVNPSIATMSPSCTYWLTASFIEMTLFVMWVFLKAKT